MLGFLLDRLPLGLVKEQVRFRRSSESAYHGEGEMDPTETVGNRRICGCLQTPLFVNGTSLGCCYEQLYSDE